MKNVVQESISTTIVAAGDSLPLNQGTPEGQVGHLQGYFSTRNIHWHDDQVQAHVAVSNKNDAILLDSIDHNPKLPFDPLMLPWLIGHRVHISLLRPLCDELPYDPASVVVRQRRQTVPEIFGVCCSYRDHLARSPVHDFRMDESLGEEYIEQERPHVHVSPLLPGLPVGLLCSLTAGSPSPG